MSDDTCPTCGRDEQQMHYCVCPIPSTPATVREELEAELRRDAAWIAECEAELVRAMEKELATRSKLRAARAA